MAFIEYFRNRRFLSIRLYVIGLLLMGLPLWANAQFTDDFSRLDSADVGNGWIEKNPTAFALLDNSASKLAVGAGYRDNIVYRPAIEDLLDVEASVEFRMTDDSPGYPQVFTRVQSATAEIGDWLDGYILYVNNSNTQAVLGRQNGSAFVTTLAGINFASSLNTTDRFRLRLRTTGISPIRLDAFVERWNGTSWDIIGQASVDDSSADRHSNSGSVGFGGYVEASYTYENFSATDLGVQGNPVPVLSSIAPDSAQEGGSPFALTVTGASFQADSTVRWNGSDRATTFVSPSELQASISAADVGAAGTSSVTVFTPAPGGGTSSAQTFTIEPVIAANPVPVLNSVSPNAATEGGSEFALTLQGSDFTNESIVRWNGSDRATAFVSANDLQATITAADIAAAGMAQVQVFTPAPGGGTSAIVDFAIDPIVVDNPTPILGSIAPASAAEGSSAFSLSVTGSDFATDSVVRWNGADRATTFISATELQAAIDAADIADAGTAAITVFTPAPGGGTSTSATFIIDPIIVTNPGPVLTAINPTSILEGSAGFVMTALGSDFSDSSVVRWNGADRATTFVSENELQADIPASDVAAPGTVLISVFTPGPGGGLSATQTLTVDAQMVTNPVPDLVSVSPVSAQSGDSSTTLTAIGDNFTADSAIAWNGELLATTFVSSQVLEAALDSSRLVDADVNTITVVTSAPGGGISTPYPFFVVEGSSTFFFDDFNASDNPQLGNNWTEKNPDAFLLEDGTIRGMYTPWDIYLNNIVYRPAAEDRQNVELGIEFTRFFNSGFAQLHARIQRDNVAEPETLRSYIFYIDDTRPPPGAAVIAVGHDIPGVNECNIQPLPFTTPLELGERYRLRFSVTGANPVLLEGNVDQFVDGQWQSVVSGAIQHDANTTPDPYFCGPGYVPDQIVNGGATGFSKWSNEADIYDNFYWIDLGGTIAPLAPQVTTLSPDSIAEGSAGFDLLVSGAYFAPNSLVRWNGVDLPTTYISPTDLQATVSASNIALAGSFDIEVFNPAPGGGISNAIQFDVTQQGSQSNPAPAMDGISPATAIAGSAGATISINGSDFVPDSVVRLDGIDLVTSYVSPTTLSVSLGPNELAQPGTAAITVSSPAPGGGTTEPLPLNILSAAEFYDDFQRPDSDDPLNGWTEKAPGAFRILNGALEKQSVSSEYRDNVIYRPASEAALDGEASVEFVIDNGVPGYPQLVTRLQSNTVAQIDTLDGYMMYANNNAGQFIVGRQTGNSFVTTLTTLDLPQALAPGETYRMRMTTVGTDPVQISAYIERLTENGYEVLGQANAEDASGSRVDTAGSAGIGGYIENGYRYDNFRYRPLP